MSFVRTLERAPESDDLHFKTLARDMVDSFSRMRAEEKLSVAYLKAHRIDEELGEKIIISLRSIEKTASRYNSGEIDLDKAVAEFTLDVPTLMRFLIHEIQPLGDDLRALPAEVNSALHRYYENQTMENAMFLVGACVHDPYVSTHWVFDNVARVTMFCDEAIHREKQLGTA